MSPIHLISPRERLLVLKSSPVLKDLRPTELAGLAQHARERRLKAGEQFFPPGQPIGFGHILVEGSADVLWKDKLIMTVGPAEAVGFLALMARMPTGITAVATSECTTLEIGAENILRSYERNFDLLLGTLRTLSREILESRHGLPGDPEDPPAVEAGVFPKEPLSLVDQMLGFVREPLFRQANLDAVAELCHLQTEIRHPAGTRLWRKGDSADSFFRIEYGIVNCDAGAGGTMRVGAGYSVGMDCMTDLPRFFEATCETEVVGLQHDSEAFLAVLEDHFELAMGLTTALARTVVELRSAGILDAGSLPFANVLPRDVYT